MRTLSCILAMSLLAAPASAKDAVKSIHIFVALCDNQSQGIVPVPKQLGNGNDPRNNLYWGAMYGTKTFMKKSKDWTLLTTAKDPGENILERVIFQHKTKRAFIVADAYRGNQIKIAVKDFLNAAAGNNPHVFKHEKVEIGIAGGADLVAYVGHNGLMDFKLEAPKQKKPGEGKNAIVLACKSKPCFKPYFDKLGCRSVLLTTGFMAPEAYSLEAALAGWLGGESPERIRSRAAAAYNKYQKCGLSGAKRLFYAE
ncbi:MAG: hypothetical protein ACYTE3_24285 [Planctomycetota bacterium]|jgi:hypothetical protein